MKRKRSLGVLVLGMLCAGAGYAVGQSAPPEQQWVVYGPSTRISADELRYDEDRRTLFARGQVRIVSESSTISADAADLHLPRSTREAVDLDILLQGKVRVLVTPLSGALR